MVTMTRRAYAENYGPTKGDMVRLGDTNLWIEIEQDLTRPGDELMIGAGKSFRDGEGIKPGARASTGALDIRDPTWPLPEEIKPEANSTLRVASESASSLDTSGA